MLTSKQRSAFFALANAAFAKESPGVPFDEWRHGQMIAAGLPPSISKVDAVCGYDSLMAHFAVLAFDTSAIGYFAAAEERRLRWCLNGLARDLEYLSKTTIGSDYIAGIYRQAGLLPQDFSDAPAVRLWTVLQILDTHIRRLCAREGLALGTLPTAGQPWCFRGKGAASYAAYMALAATKAAMDVQFVSATA